MKIKIDNKIFNVEIEVFELFLKLENNSISSINQLNAEINAHLKCSERNRIYKNYLIELVDTLKDNYILGDDPLYSTLEEIERITT